MNIKKRLLFGAGLLGTVAATATLVAGVTFGLFSATPQSASTTFTSGTVSLTSDATGYCVTPADIVPGDSGTCTFVANYTGNVSAFVGLNTSTTGALYTGIGTDDSAANVLVVAITDGNSTPYANNGSNLYVGTESSSTVNTFTVTWSLPSTADNSYQNKSATIALTVEAVQSAHQTGTCSTLGSACSGVSWS